MFLNSSVLHSSLKYKFRNFCGAEPGLLESVKQMQYSGVSCSGTICELLITS